MKKAIREWVFNLFAKRITVKVSRLPNDARIEFLVNKLTNELTEQGYDIKGQGATEFFSVFVFDEEINLDGHNTKLAFRRLPKL